jgi:hypothetical protein
MIAAAMERGEIFRGMFRCQDNVHQKVCDRFLVGCLAANAGIWAPIVAVESCRLTSSYPYARAGRARFFFSLVMAG